MPRVGRWPRPTSSRSGTTSPTTVWLQRIGGSIGWMCSSACSRRACAGACAGSAQLPVRPLRHLLCTTRRWHRCCTRSPRSARHRRRVRRRAVAVSSRNPGNGPGCNGSRQPIRVLGAKAAVRDRQGPVIFGCSRPTGSGARICVWPSLRATRDIVGALKGWTDKEAISAINSTT